MKKYHIVIMAVLALLLLADCSKMPVKPDTGKNNKGIQNSFFADKAEKGSMNGVTAVRGQNAFKDTGNAIKDFFAGFKQKKSEKKQPFVLTPKIYLKILGGAGIAFAAVLVLLQFRPR